MLSAVNTWWHFINDFSPRCYGKALKIFPESSSLWHDLGVNYFHQSQAVLQEDKFPLAEKSVQALKKAISLEPTNHKHWTALGHVACHKGILFGGAQWLSGRVLDSRPKGRGFEPHGRHCVVSLSKNINPSLVLVQPRKTVPL